VIFVYITLKLVPISFEEKYLVRY